MLNALKASFAARPKKSIAGCENGTPAAVLVPVFYREGRYHLLLTKRSNSVRAHPGEITFPGGAYEPGDSTLLDTALRETREEIGISPGEVQILGELDDRPHGNYVISPFVGMIDFPYRLQPEEREIAGIIEVPIPAILEASCYHELRWEINGVRVPVDFYFWNNVVIWGSTARIVKDFLAVWTTIPL